MDNITITCPECGNEITLEAREYVVGDIIECPTCGTTLEVVAVDSATKSVEVEIIEEEK